jgi:hypothetical protein
MMANGADGEEDRKLFQKSASRGGGFDLWRLVEQLIPTAIAALIVIWTTTQVTQNQVNELKQTAITSDIQRQSLQKDIQEAQNRLIELNAKVTAYLGQQTQINSAVDARLTYIERDRRNSGR